MRKYFANIINKFQTVVFYSILSKLGRKLFVWVCICEPYKWYGFYCQVRFLRERQYPSAAWRMAHRYIFKTNFDGIISRMMECWKRSHLTDCLRTVHAVATLLYFDGGSFRSQFLFIKRINCIRGRYCEVNKVENLVWRLYAFWICENRVWHAKRGAIRNMYIDGIYCVANWNEFWHPNKKTIAGYWVIIEWDTNIFNSKSENTLRAYTNTNRCNWARCSI